MGFCRKDVGEFCLFIVVVSHMMINCMSDDTLLPTAMDPTTLMTTFPSLTSLKRVPSSAPPVKRWSCRESRRSARETLSERFSKVQFETLLVDE